jgi:myosin heavy subunit
MTAADFVYLTEGKCIEVNTLNDLKLWEEVVESFKNIKFSKEEETAVLHILAAVLCLASYRF